MRETWKSKVRPDIDAFDRADSRQENEPCCLARYLREVYSQRYLFAKRVNVRGVAGSLLSSGRPHQAS